MAKKVRNQYSGGSRITQREADTLNGCIRKLKKIALRDNLHRTDVSNVYDAIIAMRDALTQSGREVTQ